MPAAFWWDPSVLTTINGEAVYSSSTPVNWRVTATDPFNRWTRAPEPGDDLHFRGDVSSADCYIPDQLPAAPANAFAGLHLQFGPSPPTPPPTVPPPGEPPSPGTSALTAYVGTVTVADSLAVGTLEVDCGQIKQADPASLQPPVPYAITAGTLTVSSSLDWTGGTLNSNTIAGTIALAPGATGVAEPSYSNPGINQTVGLGSTIELLGPALTATSGVGSSLDVKSGDYNISNSAGFIVNNLCNFNLLPLPDDAPPTPPQPPGGGGNTPPSYKVNIELKSVTSTPNGQEQTAAGGFTVKDGGTLTFTPADRPPTSTAPATFEAPKGYIKNDGGKVILTDRVKATFGGKIDSTFRSSAAPGAPFIQTSIFQKESGSTLSLQAGSELVTTSGVAVDSGKVLFPALPTSAAEAVIEATEATATTWAFILGSTASVSFPGGRYGTLKVKGDFAWQGTVEASLSSSSTTGHDTIHVTKKVVVATAAKLQVSWASNTDMASRDMGASWDVLKSDENNGISGVGETSPQLVPPDSPGSVTMAPDLSTDKKTLSARKTSERVG